MKALEVTLRRFARRAVIAASALAIGSLVVLLALLAYLHTASGRRFLAAKVNAWVSRELLGELRIEKIDVLANDRLAISAASVLDEKGRAVLRVQGLSAKFDVLTLVAEAVFGPQVRIGLSDVRVERLEIGLYHAEKGGVSLTRAFASRTPSVAPPSSASGPHVHLPRISIGTVVAHTDLDGLAQGSAEVHALRANFDWAPELLSLGLRSDDTRVLGVLPGNVQARLDARVRVPGVTEVTLDGSAGAVPIQASFRAIADELELRLSSASLAPEAVRALLPAWPLHVPAAVRVELRGRLSAMHAELEAQAGVSRLAASGSLALSPNVTGELSITGRELDARLFAPDLERTALSVDGRLEFALNPALHVDLTTRWPKGDLFGAALPETTIHAVYGAGHVTGTAASVDPSLPISVDFDVSTQGLLGLRARARSLDLHALAPYGVSAQGELDFDATGELAQDKLVATFETRIRGLLVAPLRAQTIVVRAKIQGPTARLEQLALEIQAEGSKLAVAAIELPVWTLQSKGSLERQLVSLHAGADSEPTLQASTTLVLEHGVSLHETQLDAALNGVKHRLDLRFARFAAQSLELRDLRWQVGAGTLAGGALIGPTRRQAEFEVTGLEAEAVLKTLGLGADPFRGVLNARLRFEEDSRARQGQLQGSFVASAVPALGAVNADFSASIADSEAVAQATLSASEVGQGKLSAHAAIARAPLTLEVLSKMPGDVRLDVSAVDLAEIGRRWLPSATGALSGRVAGNVRLARAERDAPATLSYELKTRELGLRRKQADGDGALLHAELSSHGEIDANSIACQIELEDAAGPWISARIAQTLGFADVLRVLRTSSLEDLLNAPLRAEISARPRSLELLGAANPLSYRGEVAASFDVTGSARRPEIAGSLNATGLGTGGDASGKLALTLDYSAQREQYSFLARYADRARAKLEVEGQGHFGWFESGLGRDWSTHAEARVERLDLGALGTLVGAAMSGEARGRAAFTASASEFEANGALELERLALEQHALGRGRAQLRVHRGLAEAQLSLTGADSKLELSSELGLLWDGGPSIDPKRGGSLEAKVRNYQLAALAPLLRSAASDIRGPLNGFIVLGWDPADPAGKRNTRLRAAASVSGGSVTLASGAGTIQCMELRALGADNGLLQLKLTDCAPKNQHHLSVEAEVGWNGPVPEGVAAKLVFNDFPLSYEGVLLGTATTAGRDKVTRPIQLRVNLAGAQRAVEVGIPALQFDLPLRDDTRLVDLADDPAIEVTEARAPPASTGESGEGSGWLLSVKLGQWVTLQQQSMRVPVTGSLSQTSDGLLDGSIVFPEGGVVPQLGQLFRLKRGTVRFDHQAVKDGVLNIEASARTADGIVVDLYVSGTIDNPVIRFQSDPPRSQNDIVALLLGIQGSDTANSNGKQGQDLRGSATALAMNQLLRGSVLGGLQFGAGQTHKGDSVSTVSWRAGNSVWLEGRTVRSTTQRAATSGVQSSGVVDWRFARGFSLRTQLGNISGLELRWSHRY